MPPLNEAQLTAVIAATTGNGALRQPRTWSTLISAEGEVTDMRRTSSRLPYSQQLTTSPVMTLGGQQRGVMAAAGAISADANSTHSSPICPPAVSMTATHATRDSIVSMKKQSVWKALDARSPMVEMKVPTKATGTAL